jgi:hypothetical protein
VGCAVGVPQKNQRGINVKAEVPIKITVYHQHIEMGGARALP